MGNITHPSFKLNLHSRELNPCFESHDPSMMWDPVSRTYYSYCTDSAITSPYKQGIPIRRSCNLIDFEFVGYALSDEAVREGRDNGPDFKPTMGFWAPYVECVILNEEGNALNISDSDDIEAMIKDNKLKAEYRMYYSATKAFGSSESRIWLAVADKPEGPFENRGVVMDTWNTTDAEPNAIDAHVCDTADGRKFFIYGSFFGGIFIKELDAKSGMPVNPDAHFFGKCIAKKPADSYIDGPEGPAIIYNPDTDYYYLFVSYGWLGDNYDIRVGRSRDILGPYLDQEGKDMVAEGLGLKMAGSYRFEADKPYAVVPEELDSDIEKKNMPSGEVLTEKSSDKPQMDLAQNDDMEGKWKYSDKGWKFAGFRGPGHGVPFYAPALKQYFFVHHVRDGAEVFKNIHHGQASYRMHYMGIRRMFFIEDWPVFSPEYYAGEMDEPAALSKQAQTGNVEWIVLKNDDNSIAISKKGSIPEKVEKGRTMMFKGYDYENSCEVMCLAGLTEDMEMFWAKMMQKNL